LSSITMIDRNGGKSRMRFASSLLRTSTLRVSSEANMRGSIRNAS
jgi:hypothetical protein